MNKIITILVIILAAGIILLNTYAMIKYQNQSAPDYPYWMVWFTQN